MNTLKQIAAVTAMNVMSLPRRLSSSIVVVIGIAGVVGVLVSVMAMSRGFADTLLGSASADRAIVISDGANYEFASTLAPADAQTILDAPGIARDSDGDPIGSPELVVASKVARLDGGGETNLLVRGVSSAGITLRSGLELVEGRMFESGHHELIVGRQAAAEFAGVRIGDEVKLRDGNWRIVGVFDAGGTSVESGALADVRTLQSAYQRNLFNSVRVRLESPAAFDEFAASLTTDPRLKVEVLTEPEYFERAAEDLKPLFFVITNVVGSIMALGALFAALNTMYTSVSSRQTEIATLRAIGFGGAGVVTSVLTESIALVIVGAAIGAAVAAALFNGNTISLGSSTGALVAQMQVTPVVLGIAALWAIGVGLVGGLLPALRAARLPIAVAIREA